MSIWLSPTPIGNEYLGDRRTANRHRRSLQREERAMAVSIGWDAGTLADLAAGEAERHGRGGDADGGETRTAGRRGRRGDADGGETRTAGRRGRRDDAGDGTVRTAEGRGDGETRAAGRRGDAVGGATRTAVRRG